MRAGLIGDFIRNILSLPFCPCHFVQYHFVHTILSVPFCPLPFCPRTHCHSIQNNFQGYQIYNTKWNLYKPNIGNNSGSLYSVLFQGYQLYYANWNQCRLDIGSNPAHYIQCYWESRRSITQTDVFAL